MPSYTLPLVVRQELCITEKTRQKKHKNCDLFQKMHVLLLTYMGNLFVLLAYRVVSPQSPLVYRLSQKGKRSCPLFTV